MHVDVNKHKNFLFILKPIIFSKLHGNLWDINRTLKCDGPAKKHSHSDRRWMRTVHPAQQNGCTNLAMVLGDVDQLRSFYKSPVTL